MKKLFLSVSIIAGLLAANQVLAVEDSDAQAREMHNHNFIGQRAYQKAPAKDAGADAKWIGTGLVVDEEANKKAYEKRQQFRLHMIGKRPYTTAE